MELSKLRRGTVYAQLAPDRRIEEDPDTLRVRPVLLLGTTETWCWHHAATHGSFKDVRRGKRAPTPQGSVWGLLALTTTWQCPVPQEPTVRERQTASQHVRYLREQARRLPLWLPDTGNHLTSAQLPGAWEGITPQWTLVWPVQLPLVWEPLLVWTLLAQRRALLRRRRSDR